MSAISGPRAFRGSRLTTRGRDNYPSRGNRAGHEDHATRRSRTTSNLTNGTTPGQPRPSSRSGGTRRPSRRATPRGHSSYIAPSRQPHDHGRSSSSSNSKSDALRDATTQDQSVYKKHMENTFTTLGEQRKHERKNAIKDGLLADPDKPTTLANAITIVGTCQDMCAEYERVQRIVQFMVDDCEKVQHFKENIRVPSEDRMVKRYRRPAAGYEEQLPSDIRPPVILQKTLDYLMDEVVGGPDPLANVHKFVWDRTRAIRNDFSIQQVTKVDELRIAISCFERIARFHILSLHQLAGSSENSVDFDAYQEREQLNNTLLSLIYYYDDSRHKLVSPNESEFRAYCIIFEIQDQRPDLEDRAQNWPADMLKDRRVKTALNLYAAAASASDPQGPLRPQALHAIAQANTPLFFNIVRSPAVPYLMACVAEIYFNKVRRMALDTIWKAYKVKRGGNATIEDWTIIEVTNALGFDDEDQAQTFCEEHGFTVFEKEGREAYVDLGSVAGRYLSDTNPSRKQPFSSQLVEQKRRGRTLPAIINGLTAAQAQAQGLILEDTSDDGETSATNDESLFLPDQAASDKHAQEPSVNKKTPSVPGTQDKTGEDASKPGPFFRLNPSAPSFITSGNSDDPTPGTGFFGKPSALVSTEPKNPFSAPQSNNPKAANYNPFTNQNKPGTMPGPVSNMNKPDTAPSLFSNHNKQESTTPVFTTTEPITQGQSNPGLVASSSRSIFDTKPSSTPDSNKVSFGTSPFFTQKDPIKPTQTETEDAFISISPGVKAARLMAGGSQLSNPPFKFLNHAEPAAATSTLPPQVLATNIEKGPAQQSLPPPSLSFLPPSNPSSGFSFPSTQQADRADKSTNLDSATRPTITPQPLPYSQPSNAAPPSEQTIDRTAAVTSSPTFKAQPLTSIKSQAPNPAADAPRTTIAKAPPNPRPAVLDALAEGLMMDDQGLLQQFIEFTVGPIVHQAFLEVEDDESWNRAREVRAVLLSRKYFGRWKYNAWTRKLLRKGKERRATFARTMQQMAKSSRRQRNHTHVSSQSSGTGKLPDISTTDMQRSNMAPPPPPQAHSKRKSLPTDFKPDELPNAEIAFSNKRKRQEPSTESQSSKQSPRTSVQPHHKRSRTMGDSRRPLSVYEGLADFSHLDENTYDNEQVLQQARRLIGHAKLDTTRGDYFALKSRGIDPDTPLLPQPVIKRSRVDEQIERVQNLLKPSSPAAAKSTNQPGHLPSRNKRVSSQAVQVNPGAAVSSNAKSAESPDDLLAQVRKVREALAEGTAWFQAEREKSERLSSSRSSEAPLHVQQHSRIQLHSQPPDTRPQEWRPTPTRAQVRLEKTKANGLLPPDWDWNKSVTEWKLRGGTGSPRRSASRDRSGTATPVITPQKKPIGFATVTNGLGQRTVKMPDEDGEVYNDEGEGSDEEGHLMDDGTADDAEAYPEDYEDGGGEDDEDEDEDEGEEGDEDDLSPERAVLHGKGNSADTAIDLD
ncbi:MAG: hypothetical protein Q9171_001720 [Xanthocarpia ochracea]